MTNQTVLPMEVFMKPSIKYNWPYRDEKKNHGFGSQEYQANAIKIEWAGWIINDQP